MSIKSKVAVRTVHGPVAATPQPKRRAAPAVAVIDLGVYGGGVPTPSSSQPAGDDPCPKGHYGERRLDGQPLAVRMARRLSECEWVDGIFAVGCDLPAAVLRAHQTVVEPISLPHGHVIERLSAVVDRTDAEWIVYVTGNRPFVDAGLIDGLIAKATRTANCDYVGYASDSAGLRRMQHLGLAGEVVHSDAIRRLRRNADRLPGCCSIAECVEQAPGDYRLKYVPVPRELDRADLRFAVEDESDWDNLELLCESLSEVDASWQQVAQLVDSNEWLRSGMEYRNG